MMTHSRFFVVTCFWGAVLTASSFSLPANAGKSVPTNGGYQDHPARRKMTA